MYVFFSPEELVKLFFAHTCFQGDAAAANYQNQHFKTSFISMVFCRMITVIITKTCVRNQILTNFGLPISLVSVNREKYILTSNLYLCTVNRETPPKKKN